MYKIISNCPAGVLRHRATAEDVFSETRMNSKSQVPSECLTVEHDNLVEVYGVTVRGVISKVHYLTWNIESYIAKTSLESEVSVRGNSYATGNCSLVAVKDSVRGLISRMQHFQSKATVVYEND